MVSSWRDSASQQAQDDFDGLFNYALGFAEQQLSRYGEFYPFAGAVSKGGEPVSVLSSSGDEHPSSTDVIDELLSALKSAPDYRAASLTCDVRLVEGGGDAVRVDLEHSDGIAITILVPYRRLADSVEFEEMSVSPGSIRVWT